jgi:hypothetical protein
MKYAAWFALVLALLWLGSGLRYVWDQNINPVFPPPAPEPIFSERPRYQEWPRPQREGGLPHAYGHSSATYFNTGPWGHEDRYGKR